MSARLSHIEFLWAQMALVSTKAIVQHSKMVLLYHQVGSESASPTGLIQSTDQSGGKPSSVDDWEHHTFLVITCKQNFPRTGHS